MGVNAGDTLTLAISLRRIGWIESGAGGLIDVLLDVVGSNGTLMVPTFTPIHPLDSLDACNPAHIFDPQTTPPYTGAIAQRMLWRPEAIRSKHPSNSIAAIGRHAERLTQDHTAAAGAYQPFSVLAELGGRFLGIGVGDRLVGLRHEAQAKAGLLTLLPSSLGILYRDERKGLQTFVRRDVGGCVTRLPELLAPMREQGIVRDGSTGHASAVLVEAGPALQYSTDALLADPALNLCGDPNCKWCIALTRKIAEGEQA